MTELTNERDVPELLPCPFCGGTDTFIERLDYSAAYVQCDSRIDEHCACLMRGPVGVQDDDGEEIPGAAAAARAWNRRATPSSECALPPLPEPDHSLDGGTLHFYTAEQVEQIRREAVEADREHQKARIMHLTHERDKARADLSAQLARQSQGDEAEIYAIWDAAKAEAAMYIEAHCVDGEIHARHIMGAARPKVTAAPPLSSEPQARPRPYYGQDFLNWNRQQPDPPVKIGRELAVAQAAFDLMTKGDAHD